MRAWNLTIKLALKRIWEQIPGKEKVLTQKSNTMKSYTQGWISNASRSHKKAPL